MLGPGLVLSAIVFAFGCAWCHQIFRRLPGDLEEVRDGDGATRAAILALWAITAALIWWMLSSVLGLF